MLIMKELVWLAGKEQYMYPTELRRTKDESMPMMLNIKINQMHCHFTE